MRSQLFDSAIVGTANKGLDFIGNILESSTEHSISGKDMEGKVLVSETKESRTRVSKWGSISTSKPS